jgi:hypothetical protein
MVIIMQMHIILINQQKLFNNLIEAFCQDTAIYIIDYI